MKCQMRIGFREQEMHTSSGMALSEARVVISMTVSFCFSDREALEFVFDSHAASLSRIIRWFTGLFCNVSAIFV